MKKKLIFLLVLLALLVAVLVSTSVITTTLKMRSPYSNALRLS